MDQNMFVMILAMMNTNNSSWIYIAIAWMIWQLYEHWTQVTPYLFAQTNEVQSSLKFTTRYVEGTWEPTLFISSDMRAITNVFLTHKHTSKSHKVMCRKEEMKLKYSSDTEQITLLENGTYELQCLPLRLEVHRSAPYAVGQQQTVTTHVYCLSSSVWTARELHEWVQRQVAIYESDVQTAHGQKLFVFNFKCVIKAEGRQDSWIFERQDLDGPSNPNPETFDFVVSVHKPKILALLDRLNNKEWYRAHGERRKQGFAFCGKSGTGKTKIAVAMALRSRKHLIIVDCTRVDKVEHLESILNLREIQQVSINHQNAMYLFEEFSMKVFEPKKEIPKKDDKKDKDEKPDASKDCLFALPIYTAGLNLSAFLSLLDGPRLYDGLVFCATTNEEDLDPRIVRDGRLTLFRFTRPTAVELQEFFRLHGGPDVPLGLLSSKLASDEKFSLATAMTLVKQAKTPQELLVLLQS